MMAHRRRADAGRAEPLNSTVLVSIAYTGGAAGAVSLVIHSYEAVRMSERRGVRPTLVVVAAAGAIYSGVACVLAGAVLVPRLDKLMFPIVASVSVIMGIIYAYGVYTLLQQRAIGGIIRVAFTAATMAELVFGFLNIWIMTTALVLWG